MLRPPGFQRLVREQQAARYRNPLVRESIPFSKYANRALIQARLFQRWLSGSQRLKGLMSRKEISSRFRLTERENFFLLILLYFFLLVLLFG